MKKISKIYTEKTSVLNTDTFDRSNFEKLYNHADKFRDSVDVVSKHAESNVALMGDMWASLYKLSPEFKSDSAASENTSIELEFQKGDILDDLMQSNNISNVLPTQPVQPSINETMMRKVMAHNEYEKFHNNTRLDEFSSALGTMRMGEVINEWFVQEKKRDEQFNELLNQLSRAEKEQQKNNDSIDQRKEEGKETTNKQKEKRQQLNNQIQQLQKDLSTKIENNLDSNKIGQMITQARKSTQDSKDDVSSLLGGAGSGEAELKSLPLGEQLQLANVLRDNKKVKEIAEWAGKFKQIARKKQKSKFTNSLDRSGVTLGNDVERLLPQELALYMRDETRLEFLRRFTEKQTMMFSPSGKEITGKGAMVVCLDESGSMNMLINQAKGFVLALGMIAKKQNRDFCVIPFSNSPGEKVVCEKGKVRTPDIIQLANSFLGGGTQYMRTLNEAMSFIKKGKRFKNADIIFVTDGAPQDTGALDKALPNYLIEKKTLNINIMALLIGDNCSSEYTKMFADQTIKAKDFDTTEAESLFSI